MNIKPNLNTDSYLMIQNPNHSFDHSFAFFMFLIILMKNMKCKLLRK